jgi:polysaccharide biosynthesis protein PslA
MGGARLTLLTSQDVNEDTIALRFDVRRLPLRTLSTAMAAVDVLVLGGLAGLMSMLPNGAPPALAATTAGIAVFVVAGIMSGLYSTSRAFAMAEVLPRILGGMAAVTAVLMALEAVSPVAGPFPLLQGLAFILAGGLCLSGLRLVFAAGVNYMLANGYAFNRVALVHRQTGIRRFAAEMEIASGARMRVAEILPADFPGAGARLSDLLSAGAVDSVVFSGFTGAEAEAHPMFQTARVASVTVFTALPRSGFPAEMFETIDSGPAVLVCASRPPLTAWDEAQKRIFDVVFALCVLPFALPVIAVAALAVVIDSKGPAFFLQRRYGYGGREFSLLKLRSMRVAADEGGDVEQAEDDDRRVTRVGRFIRAFKIDELPQILNVLQGRMSVVGPRAHASRTVLQGLRLEDHDARYMDRHRVKPGLTSWAIVNGASGAMDTVEKLKKAIDHDLHYIRHWSIWFDMVIVVMTIAFIFGEARLVRRDV